MNIPKAITASKEATLTAMTGGSFSGYSHNSTTIDGWHCLTKEFNWESDVVEWIAAWRYMEDMTFWIADKDDEEQIKGSGFNEIDNLGFEPSGNDVIYGPANFTDEELAVIFEEQKAIYFE